MIAIIAAVAKNGVIGKDGKIPWNIPEDMEHFKELTMGKNIVMGRITYEEIGHPLPGRMTYLVSSHLKVEEENCHTVSSLTEALECAGMEDVFICGGASLYREGMDFADTLFLTEIQKEVAGDTFFPEIPNMFTEAKREKRDGYDFVMYQRK